jgi:hypothetical protein
MPKTIVVGLIMGEADRGIAPCRRCRTAETRGGYHVEEVDANIETSRRYMILGLPESVDDSKCSDGMLMTSSKKDLTLLGAVEVIRGDGRTNEFLRIAPPGAISVKVSCGARDIGVGASRSSTSSQRGPEGC